MGGQVFGQPRQAVRVVRLTQLVEGVEKYDERSALVHQLKIEHCVTFEVTTRANVRRSLRLSSLIAARSSATVTRLAGSVCEADNNRYARHSNVR